MSEGSPGKALSVSGSANSLSVQVLASSSSRRGQGCLLADTATRASLLLPESTGSGLSVLLGGRCFPAGSSRASWPLPVDLRPVGLQGVPLPLFPRGDLECPLGKSGPGSGGLDLTPEEKRVASRGEASSSRTGRGSFPKVLLEAPGVRCGCFWF